MKGLLWTSPNSCIASANVGLLCNAEVDFVDIDSETYNMCLLLYQKLRDAEKNEITKNCDACAFCRSIM